MRALLIVTNLAGGGAEKAMLKFAAGLGARGHDVRLLLLERVIEHALPPAVTIDAVLAEGERVSGGWIAKRRLAWRLSRWHRAQAAARPFDLVLSTLPFCDEVVRLAGLPRPWFRIANTLSVEVLRSAAERPARVRRRLARLHRIYRDQRLVAVSEGVAADLRGAMGLAHEPVEVVRNPFDADAIRAAAARLEPGLPAQPYLLHVGRFGPQKRHDLLLDAFARSGVQHRLVLLAHPAPGLEALVRARGLTDRVLVAGFRPNPYPWMARAAALVLCSDFEGMPNVLVEALACGTPVVSTDCPSGPAEVLRGPLAPFLVPCGDPQALADAIQRVVAAPPPIGAESVAAFSPAAALDALERLAGPARAAAGVAGR